MAIMDIANQFEELFNILVLMIFFATLFILCFVMYHASLFDLLSIRAAQDFSYVTLVAIQVFLYCYWGNEVRLESEEIANACWQVDFVGIDVQFQKSLVLMIRRCQKPIVLTAGKFTKLSLETYVWVRLS
ncbi:hypothetical protein AMK59_7488 [Oryctes borbonicus]|uniref:Uncharacterized protein n=1 Tax=Oryctes borbonicus TaxID=1629725 RepID=A0A0T6ATE2_9SCAR|nr:hypothetical protein AMK59_7488 [Oryctes borbonicus]